MFSGGRGASWGIVAPSSCDKSRRLQLLLSRREGGVNRLPASRSSTVLHCRLNGDFMEGRGDNVSGVNLRCSLDKSCQRLQHLRINIGVVSFGIGLVFPQTDCSHINFAGTSECDFVLKAILLTKQREEEIVLSLGGLLLPRSLRFRMSALGGSLFDDCVNFSADQKRKCGDVQPKKQNDHRPQRSIRPAVVVEEVQVPARP